MAEPSAIKIRAKGKMLLNSTGDARLKANGGPGAMPLDELQKIIAAIESGKVKAPAAAKPAATNGSKGKSAASTAVSTATKGKGASTPAPKGSASKSAPAKSTAQKSSPVKGKAAQGAAKRPTTAASKGKATTAQAVKTTAVKGRSSAAPKGKVADNQRVAARSARAAATTKGKTAAAKPQAAGRKGQPVAGRVAIDASKVDWFADTNVGRLGKRKIVLDALRRFDGDYAKTFKNLARYASEWYPNGGSLGTPESMLKWLIGRVAYDYVSKSGQHVSGVRAGYGQSNKPSDVRRRELRASRAENQAKTERAATRAQRKPAASKGKTAPKPAARGKVAGKRAPARKGAVVKGKVR